MLNQATTENLKEFLDFCEINSACELNGNGMKELNGNGAKAFCEIDINEILLNVKELF